MKYSISILVLVFSLSLTNCSQRIASYTVASTKQTSLNIDKTKAVQVTGKSIGFLGMGANIDDAMNKALQSAGPQFDLLVDAQVKLVSYPLVSGFVVTGLAVNSKEMKSLLGNEGYQKWLCGKEHYLIK